MTASFAYSSDRVSCLRRLVHMFQVTHALPGVHRRACHLLTLTGMSQNTAVSFVLKVGTTARAVAQELAQWQSVSPPADDGMETRTACNPSSTKEHHVLLLLVCSLQAHSPSPQVCHLVKQLHCLNFNCVFEPSGQSGTPQETTAKRLQVALLNCVSVVHYMCRHCTLCVHALSTTMQTEPKTSHEPLQTIMTFDRAMQKLLQGKAGQQI